MQPAPRVDSTFAPPIVGRGVPANCGIDGQIRAPPATAPPSFALEGVRAVPAQHPGVVQRDHRRDLAAEPRESPQVEVGSVQVVQVQDVGGGPKAIQADAS